MIQYQYAADLAIQPDGRIVLGARLRYQANGSSSYNFAAGVVRFLSNGTLDATFGTAGKIVEDFGSTNDRLAAILLRPNGKILLAGEKQLTNASDGVFLQLNSNGTRDTTFDGDGIYTFSFSDRDYIGSPLLQANGRLLVPSGSAESSFANPTAFVGGFVESPSEITLHGAASTTFRVRRSDWGVGQIVAHGGQTNESLNRLSISGTLLSNGVSSIGTTEDSGQTFVSSTVGLSGLNVVRRVTVPTNGTQSFARTTDAFTNPTGSSINALIQIDGNYATDGDTVLFATSDGDAIAESSDVWIGLDDSNPTGGAPATIQIFRSLHGQQPRRSSKMKTT